MQSSWARDRQGRFWHSASSPPAGRRSLSWNVCCSPVPASIRVESLIQDKGGERSCHPYCSPCRRFRRHDRWHGLRRDARERGREALPRCPTAATTRSWRPTPHWQAACSELGTSTISVFEGPRRPPTNPAAAIARFAGGCDRSRPRRSAGGDAYCPSVEFASRPLGICMPNAFLAHVEDH
jgi:hypothetical protein